LEVKWGIGSIGNFSATMFLELEKLQLEVVEEGRPALLAGLVLQLDLLERIKDVHKDDPECQRIREQLTKGSTLIITNLLTYQNLPI
jgi:hypothetical protein